MYFFGKYLPLLSCNTINWVSDWWAQSIYSTRYIGDPTTWEVLWSGEYKYPDVSLPLNKILDLSIALNQRPLAKVVTQRREKSYRVSRIDKHLRIGTNLTKSSRLDRNEIRLLRPGLFTFDSTACQTSRRQAKRRTIDTCNSEIFFLKIQFFNGKKP